MSAVKVPLGHSCWTPEYLLGHSERYRVESAEGIVGYVEEVVWAGEGGEPLALLVRTGEGDLVRVAIADVVELHPDGERIVVR